jgi:hypothetical protein
MSRPPSLAVEAGVAEGLKLTESTMDEDLLFPTATYRRLHAKTENLSKVPQFETTVFLSCCNGAMTARGNELRQAAVRTAREVRPTNRRLCATLFL